ncbi:MAG: metallopeptidase family protein [Verrucomicrobiota bacterium]|jgi:predicted Zn-dependent protease with MMP-like domain|nr:metallopeptidase family protein [Verrucomicrobiota bacterium]
MKTSRLEQLAREEVARLLRRLPADVSAVAEALPVFFFARPTAEMIRRDHLEPDLLGLFVGSPYAEAMASDDVLPPGILLFLQNLWDYANGEEEAFREEIRVTYLHELGHSLGLEEEDLEQRGLE